jgi:hypothetical protein
MIILRIFLEELLLKTHVQRIWVYFCKKKRT